MPADGQLRSGLRPGRVAATVGILEVLGKALHVAKALPACQTAAFACSEGPAVGGGHVRQSGAIP